MIVIPIDSIKKQMKDIVEKEIKYNEELEIRTINALSKYGIGVLSKKVKDDTGLTQAEVKRRIRESRAVRGNPDVTWYIKSRRFQYPGLRAVKRNRKPAGISYLEIGKKRVVQITPKRAGVSAPFIINGVNSGKKAAVFVKNASEKRYRIRGTKNQFGGRLLGSYIGHSLPMIIKIAWDNGIDYEGAVKKLMAERYPKERVRQSERMKYFR